MKRKISAEGMVSSDNSSEINNDGREPPSKKEKQYSSNHVFSILREYDPYILQKIFSYCHPKFMFETLMITCSEWYWNYFQKKQFVLFLKEWLLERWNFLIRDLDTHELDDEQKSAIIPNVLQKFNTEMKDEEIEQLLKYGLRFLKLFLNEHPFKRRKTKDTMSDEDDEDEEDEILEEESSQSENEEDEEDEEEKESEDEEPHLDVANNSQWILLQTPTSSRCYSLEIIFTIDTQPLYKLNWENGYSIFDSSEGNIINVLHDGNAVFANFYGGYYYPDYDRCAYRRTDFWMKLSNHQGTLADQLKHILFQWSIEDSYENALNLLTIIGKENPNSMLSKTNYEFYSWDEGEAYGIIHKMPWTLNDYVKQQQYDLYLLGDGRSNVSTIVDDRCFSDFSFFEGLARINEASFKRLIAMAPISFRKDERVIPFLSSNASAFKYLHESLRHDKKMLMQMLAVNGNILKYLSSEEYQKVITVDKEMVKFALKHGCSLKHIPSNISFDKELALCAVSGGCTIKDLPTELRNDLEVVLLAVKSHPFTSLQFAKKLIDDKDAALQLVKYSPNAFRWISGSVKKDHREVTRVAIETFFDALRFAIDETDEEFMELARQSLAKLLEKEKKLCVKFTNSYQTILEIKEKRHQLAFMIERVSFVGGPSFQQVFGPCIEELGYDAVLTFNLLDTDIKNKTEDELIQGHVYPFLEKEQSFWEHLIVTSALQNDQKIKEIIQCYRGSNNVTPVV